MPLQDFFNQLVAFDGLPDKAEQYNRLFELVGNYKKARPYLSPTEFSFITYIVAERCYSQGYEMSYTKAYESSPYCSQFFKLAFELVAEVLSKTDSRYIRYKETARL